MGIHSVFRGVRQPKSVIADCPPPCIIETANGPEFYPSLPSVPYTGMSWGHLYIWSLLLRKYKRYNLEVSHGRDVVNVKCNKKNQNKSVDFY